MNDTAKPFSETAKWQSGVTLGLVDKYMRSSELNEDIDTPSIPMCTDDELGEAFTRNCCSIATYWSSAKDVTDEQRVNGAIGDVLNLLDGRSPGFPIMQMLSPKHGDNTCVVERDGKLTEVFVDRFTTFWGGRYDEFVQLRTEAATKLAED